MGGILASAIFKFEDNSLCFHRLLFAEALSFKVNGATEVRETIHCALSLAVENLHLGKVRSDEDGTMVSLGCIQHLVEALALLSVVVHHRLDAEFVNSGIAICEESVEVGRWAFSPR